MISTNSGGGNIRPAVTVKGAAEQIKTQGEAEVERGTQLQQDGVDLQEKGAQELKYGDVAQKMGQAIKEQSQKVVDAGQAQVAQGEQQISDGHTKETAGRESEIGHTGEFSGALDDAKSAYQSAQANLGTIESNLSAEKDAVKQQTDQLAGYAADLATAGGLNIASRVIQNKAAKNLAEEKAAFADAEAGTAAMKEGLDQQAAGRTVSTDGRNDLRKSDDLRDQSEVASNRASAHGDRAAAHFNEAGNLKDESKNHSDKSKSFDLEATVVTGSAIVAGAAADNSNQLSDLYAAVAQINSDAADELSKLSQFKDEAKTTFKDSITASGQSIREEQRAKYYSNLGDALNTEADSLIEQSQGEANLSDQKLFQAGKRAALAGAEKVLEAKAEYDAGKFADESAQFKTSGDAKIAEGSAQQQQGTQKLEAALGQISNATTAQEAAHAEQVKHHTTLTDLNESSAETIASRENLLASMKEGNKAQGDALLAQAGALAGFTLDQKVGSDSQATRGAILNDLQADQATIADGLAQVEEGLTTRTEGADIVDKGVKGVNFGQSVFEAGEQLAADGTAHTEEGRQKQAAGQTIAGKGQKLVDVANQALGGAASNEVQEAQAKAAAEIPFHVAN